MQKYLIASFLLYFPMMSWGQSSVPDPKFVASEVIQVAKPLPAKTASQEFFILQGKPVTKEEYNLYLYKQEQIKNEKESGAKSNHPQTPQKP